MKYRRRFEIIADVLRVAGQGSKKTRIMYLANLSHMLLRKYLGETLRLGFLRYNGDIYEITDQGQLFLDHFVEFSSKYTRLQQNVERLKFEEETLNRMCTLGKARIKKNQNFR
jgi:predicted transcriptional regulator